MPHFCMDELMVLMIGLPLIGYFLSRLRGFWLSRFPPKPVVCGCTHVCETGSEEFRASIVAAVEKAVENSGRPSVIVLSSSSPSSPKRSPELPS